MKNRTKATLILLVFFIIIAEYFIIDWEIYPKKEVIKEISFQVKKYITKETSNPANGNIRIIGGLQHDLSVREYEGEFLVPWIKNEMSSPGYLTLFKDNEFFIATGQGRIFLYKDNKYEELNSNLFNNVGFKNYKAIVNGVDLGKRMGVKGVYFDSIKKKIYVSYHKKISEPYCYALGIDVASIDEDKLLTNKLLTFSEFFKGNNCVSDFNAHESGGKINKLKNNILLTYGSFGISDRNKLMDKNNELGGVIAIRDNGKGSTVLAKGLRNQQGLAVAKDRIFISSHGPMGGDIFSLVRAGDNFGWPTHSYGFSYEMLDIYSRPMSPKFTEPTFYFLPSIATSALVFYEGNEFPRFKNKFILGSLKNKKLYVIDYLFEFNRVLSIEEYRIDYRIRDIGIDTLGEIYLITDEGKILKISRSNTDIKDKNVETKLVDEGK